jgi:hypothetical protein
MKVVDELAPLLALEYAWIVAVDSVDAQYEFLRIAGQDKFTRSPHNRLGTST